jgi:ABC-type polysaccharide/polyol phosphate transport system ATPase subunit
MLMATNSMVEVEHLSKLYARSPSAARRRAAGVFGRMLFGRPQKEVKQLQASEFWALRGIRFRVERGEALGIIGLNGSGKTTLLRLLAGQLLPDEGEIRLAGSTAALIDFTAGFRTSATGRENIFLKGAMLGRSRAEMAAAFDGIVAFTELGDAINAPVSSYSTGMLMRLAFAINVASQPDILLIDETLAVGDFRFRQKCLARLREIRHRSCFILVSHSMRDIKHFCSRVIVLHKGRVVFEGKPEAAVSFYETMDVANQTPEQRHQGILKPWIHNTDAVADLEHCWCDVDGRPINEIQPGETLYFHAAFTLNHTPRQLIMGIPVWSESGQYVTGFSTEVADYRFLVEAGQRAVFRLEVPNLAFNPGTYISNFALTDGPEFLVREDNPSLTVRANTSPHWGVVSLPYKWRRVEESNISRTIHSQMRFKST